MLRIKEAREAKGWTQERLAEAMSTTQQTIQRWESGQTDVKSTQLKPLANCLDVTVSYLLCIDEDERERISELSDEERDILNYYRATTNFGKRMIHEKSLQMAEEFPQNEPDGTFTIRISKDMNRDDLLEEAVRFVNIGLAAGRTEEEMIGAIQELAEAIPKFPHEWEPVDEK